MTTPAADPWTRAHAWRFRLAVLLCCATYPVIWVGGLVTTTDAGMAVPDWPSTYGYNLFLYPWTSWIAGPWDLFIEHGHRLLAALCGFFTLALAAVVWFTRASRSLKLLVAAAVVGVIGQGVLGGARVLFDARLLAQIHGTAGPAFFALTAVLAMMTSRRWTLSTNTPASNAANPSADVTRIALFTMIAVVAQLMVGARLRHFPLGGNHGEFQAIVVAHLFLAAIVLVHALLLARRLRIRSTLALAALVVGQVLLGLGTWVANFGYPAWLRHSALTEGHVVQARSLFQSLVTTFHQATGSLILALSVAITVAVFAARARRDAQAMTHREGDRPFERIAMGALA